MFILREESAHQPFLLDSSWTFTCHPASQKQRQHTWLGGKTPTVVAFGLIRMQMCLLLLTACRNFHSPSTSRSWTSRSLRSRSLKPSIVTALTSDLDSNWKRRNTNYYLKTYMSYCRFVWNPYSILHTLHQNFSQLTVWKLSNSVKSVIASGLFWVRGARCSTRQCSKPYCHHTFIRLSSEYLVISRMIETSWTGLARCVESAACVMYSFHVCV